MRLPWATSSGGWLRRTSFADRIDIPSLGGIVFVAIILLQGEDGSDCAIGKIETLAAGGGDDVVSGFATGRGLDAPDLVRVSLIAGDLEDVLAGRHVRAVRAAGDAHAHQAV